MLQGIKWLHTECFRNKQDICAKITLPIKEVMTTLRQEIFHLEMDVNWKMEMTIAASSGNAVTVQEVKEVVAANSNVTANHELDVKHLYTIIFKLSDKCLDLETFPRCKIYRSRSYRGERTQTNYL